MDHITLQEKISLGKSEVLNNGLYDRQASIGSVLFILDQDGIPATVSVIYDTTSDTGRIRYEIICNDKAFQDILESFLAGLVTDFTR